MKKITLILISIIIIFHPVIASQSYNKKLEVKVHELINKERMKHGLKPFKYSKKLSQIARAHSIDMANRDYTSHYTPEGLNPWQRAGKAGFIFTKKKKTE